MYIALIVVAARQFFDESIQCLRLNEECIETESDFKDDGLLEQPTTEEPEYLQEDDDPVYA